MTKIRTEFKIAEGTPLPYGATAVKNGVNFSIPTHDQTSLSLCLFQLDHEGSPYLIFETPFYHRTGKVWHIQVSGIEPKTLYAYKNQHQLILDPYAKEVYTPGKWGENHSFKPAQSLYTPLGIISEHRFDWGSDMPPHLEEEDLIIYEMHVRGLTQDPSSGVHFPGLFKGIAEKIPYLKRLGINAVELLPSQEFNENEYLRTYLPTKENLYNFWGYSTVNFFSPMARYASDPFQCAAEFKAMVKELHQAEIAVILDIVFNHTAEGDKTGPAYSFRVLDHLYYIQDGNGRYLDYTGCGNTVNSNHPVVADFIVNCLRYWVTEYHVDGFRFDLASALTRGSNGAVLANPLLIQKINADPVLGNTLLIAEAWDASGLYQVGSFPLHNGRWLEWNGRYRDAIRKFIKGTPFSAGEFGTRICGSQDLYGKERKPYHSINYVTAHDGFSLRDLVSYNRKHNLDNGEDNRDGFDYNDSWNCGIEGPTDQPAIVKLRERQMRNFHLALMVSLGTPMVLMGDEYGHTKRGNNNTWCHDNSLNWFQWNLLETNCDFLRFYQQLIQFRKTHPHFRRTAFLTPEDIIWHGKQPGKPNWDGLLVAYTLIDPEEQNDLYIAFNAGPQDVEITLPQPPAKQAWHWIVNTGNLPPEDIWEEGQSPVCRDRTIKLVNFSAIVLKSI
jgi:isoamylase/glycogen operon protein